MLYSINSVIILVLFLSLCAGCSDEYRSAGADMTIKVASIVSVSDDRPAEVVIGAFGFHYNGCVNTDGNVYVYADRYGNEIHLTGRMEIFVGGTCEQAETEVYGEVTVKNLEVGEYKIVSNYDPELQWFRIESDAAYVDIEPIINDFTVSPIVSDGGELEDTSYHVTVGINGIRLGALLYETGCEPILKTDIERSEDVINIDMWRMVPNTGSGCDIVLEPYLRSGYHPLYNTEIELGRFSVGAYRVVINGTDYLLDVPLHND